MEERLYKFWQRAYHFVPFFLKPDSITFERIVDFARAVHDYAQAAQDVPIDVTRDIAILEKIIRKADQYSEEYADDPQFLESRELKKTQRALWNSVDAIFYNITRRLEKALGIRHTDWIERAMSQPYTHLARVFRAQLPPLLDRQWTLVQQADQSTEKTLNPTTLYALAKATHDFLHAVIHGGLISEDEGKDMLHVLQLRIVPRLATRLTRDEMIALRSQIRHIYNRLTNMVQHR